MTTATQTTTRTTADRYYTSRRGSAFGCDGPQAGYRARITCYGDVTVWDAVAGYWTTCHDLTPAQIRTIRSRARAK